MKKCKIKGCDNKSVCRSWCDKHYRRFRRHGNPLTDLTKVVDLTGRQFGEWSVLRRATTKRGRWVCRCLCEKIGEVSHSSLVGGASKSCGCVNRQHPQCTVEGCAKQSNARGLCRKHYSRFKRHGDPNRVRTISTEGTCTILGCALNRWARGLCQMHWHRIKRTGDAGSPNSRFYLFEKFKIDTRDDSKLWRDRKVRPDVFLYLAHKEAKKRVMGNSEGSIRYYKFDPIMSLEEWLETYINDPDFLKCYREWQLSGFQRRMCPVPDHDTENGQGYTVRNIEWVPFFENSLRANEKRVA
jgi:hypothetical protein